MSLIENIVCTKYNEQLRLNSALTYSNELGHKFFIFDPLKEKPISMPPIRMHGIIYFSGSKKTKQISADYSICFANLKDPFWKNKEMYAYYLPDLNTIKIEIQNFQIENINMFISYNYKKLATKSSKIQWCKEGF